MKTLLTTLGVLLLLGTGASVAQAQQYPWPCAKTPPVYCPVPPLRAPDACGPGFYAPNQFGMVYGPNFNVYPPFPPFQGMLPIPSCPNNGGGSPGFATHPFLRSPRDFYMAGEEGNAGLGYSGGGWFGVTTFTEVRTITIVK